MVSNQVLKARVTAGLLSVCVALAACSHMHQSEQTAPAPVSAAPVAEQVAAPSDMTATEAAIASGSAAAPAAAPSDAAAVVNPTAPKHYVVKRGDTLWGIAAMYLRDPWLWPEVWVINPQVPNPHLIYPGDTLSLAFGADGRPMVSLEQAGALRMDPRLRTSPLDNAIPTISYASIAAFLTRPAVLSEEEMRKSAYVLAFRDMHETAGTGMEIYIRNLAAVENARYAVVHVGGPLRDPDDGKIVGYEGIYTGTALVQRAGEPVKALLIDSTRETVRGDRVLSSDNNQAPANFTLRAPAQQINGRIIDVVGYTDLVGQFEVVVINRGLRQGLAPGNVLAIDHQGENVRDLFRNGKQIGDTNGVGSSFAPVVRLPNERAGTLLVFRVFDRVSYGLVVGASDIIHVQDLVRNP
jgi:LysM repeat protein